MIRYSGIKIPVSLLPSWFREVGGGDHVVGEGGAQRGSHIWVKRG